MVVTRGHGENCVLQGAAEFDSLLSSEVEDLRGDLHASGDGGSVSWFAGFSDKPSDCRLNVLDDIKWDFSDVSVKFEPLAAFEGAEDLVESKDFELNYRGSFGVEDGDGVEESEEVTEQFVDVVSGSHLSGVVKVRRFCLKAGFVFLDLFLLDEARFAFHPGFVEDAPCSGRGEMVDSEMGIDSIGMEYRVLVFPGSGAEGGGEWLVKHSRDQIAGGGEAVVVLAEGGCGFLDNRLHRSGGFGVFVCLKDALGK